MLLRFSSSMKSITISSNYGGLDSMKVKIGSRPLSYRSLFYTILVLAFLLPFVFILTALVTLERVEECSSLDCLGRRLSPNFLGRRSGDSARVLMTDLYELLDQVDTKEVPIEARLPGSFSEFLSEMNNNQYDIKAFAVFLKATNLKSNLTLWKFGTLPPALIAFRGHTYPIDPSWHMLGLGYQAKTNLDSVKNAAVIHYNGQCKPWLEIGFKRLQSFWTKHVNYSDKFIRNCYILAPEG